MCAHRRALALAFTTIAAFSTPGPAPAQELSAPGRSSTQLEQKIASTYIVKFDASVDPTLIRRRAASIASRFRGRLIHTYDTVYPGFAIRMGETAAANLAAEAGDLGIASITPDVMVSINVGNGPGADARPCWLTNTCPSAPPPAEPAGQDTPWNITRVLGVNPPTQNYSTIRACVIDTGIQGDHPDLNVAAGRNIIADSTNAEDNNGHGTHVAGIIGGVDNLEGIVGVAPGVTVVPVKVLDASGSGSLADVVDGIEWAAGVGNCTIANLSLGAGSSVTVMDDAVACASGDTPDGYRIDCSANKLLVTIAAGNDSTDIITGKGKGYTPARASTGPDDNIFTIASIAEGDGWSSYSNYHGDTSNNRVDFALPGQSIKSTWIGSGYKTISGTSMAAPHMAGLLARKIAKDANDAATAEPPTTYNVGEADIGNSAFCQSNCATTYHSGKGGSGENYNIIQVDY